MNPIEHLWGQMAVDICDIDNAPTTGAQLRVARQRALVALGLVKLRILLRSMTCWLCAVLAACGRNTHY